MDTKAVDMEVEVLEAVDLVGAMVDTVAVVVKVVLEVSEVVAMGVVLAASEAVAMGVVLAASEAVDMEVVWEASEEEKVDTEVVDLEAAEVTEEVMEDMANMGRSYYLITAQVFSKIS